MVAKPKPPVFQVEIIIKIEDLLRGGEIKFTFGLAQNIINCCIVITNNSFANHYFLLNIVFCKPKRSYKVYAQEPEKDHKTQADTNTALLAKILHGYSCMPVIGCDRSHDLSCL